MTLNITLVNESGSITTASVQKADKLSALAHAAAAAFGIPPNNQKYLYDGNPLAPDVTFENAGISDGDLIVIARQVSLPNNIAGRNDSSAANLTQNSNARVSDRAGDNQNLPNRSQPPPSHAPQNLTPQMQQLFTDFLRGVNPNPGGAIGQSGQGRVTEMPANNVRSTNFLDPMSMEGQKAIEEQIRQQNINQNMEAALEHNPEAFGRVFMLFIDCKINSTSSVKAFIDSGAQMTIVSKACAERCGIVHLIDTRFSGMAQGVGTAKILGRIHLALMTIGSEVFEITLTVLDSVGGSYDILLGLDMLRKHQASINLKDNCLQIGNTTVPFLGEKDIPASMRGEEVDPREMPKMQQPPMTPGTVTGSNVPAPSQPPFSTFGSTANKPMGSNTGSSASVPTHPAPSAFGSATNTNANPGSLQSPIDPGVVNRIVEIGFSKADAERALRACNGDLDQAVALLMAQQMNS